MPLVVFKSARKVRVLVDVENSKVRENVIAAEFVVGCDRQKQVSRPFAAV
jgi:hypothetical protein